MGFWSTLINSSMEATHWLTNNAGSIAQAVGVVTQVASSLPLAENDIDVEEDNVFPPSKSNIENAEKALGDAADNEFKQPPLSDDSDVRAVTLVALWPTPSSAQNPKVIPEIGMDINKFLASEKIPVSAGDGNSVDIGEEIANQLFNPSPDFKNASDTVIQFNKVDIHIGKSSSITGGMAFYQIPLGNPGTYKAWHSHIRLFYKLSNDDKRTFQQEKTALAIKQHQGNSVSTSPGGSYNSATLTVQWNGSSGVANIMSTAIWFLGIILLQQRT
ncbi:hypothetical protein FDECE_2445 [Fusarium decemcellulare]|nr:hypothetical protein FDECE_2445 [Fusarium decemcellulare]